MPATPDHLSPNPAAREALRAAAAALDAAEEHHKTVEKAARVLGKKGNFDAKVARQQVAALNKLVKSTRPKPPAKWPKV